MKYELKSEKSEMKSVIVMLLGALVFAAAGLAAALLRSYAWLVWRQNAFNRPRR